VTELLEVMHVVPDNFPDSVISTFKCVLCRIVLEISAVQANYCYAEHLYCLYFYLFDVYILFFIHAYKQLLH